MPGNELGDRVHNFFAQDNASQGQHQSHVLEGNWPVPNNNFWVTNQRQIDILNSTGKNYATQNSDIDRGQSSYPVHVTHGFSFPQSNQRPDFFKSQSLNEQQYSNGSVYGNQFYQTRQNEANFLAVDTDSDQRHLIASTGLSVHELQQGSGREQQAQASDRSETSVPPLSFDLFGGQQQMSHQQASMLQAFQRQQSGQNNMHQLQQQLMIRKMQELQRQQQLQQLNFRPQNLINQGNPFTRQATGIQSSTLVNGTPSSDASHYPWTAEPGTNWLSQGSSAMQGSSSGLVFPTNLGQTQCLTDLVPQQVDQSLYGVPVSSSRGLAVNQYSQKVADRTSTPQMATSSSSLHGNQHNFLLDQIGGPEDTSISRQKLQNENIVHVSSQSPNIGKMDMVDSQQVNSMHMDTPQQDLRRQELATRSETFHERSTRQISLAQEEVALDPTEEKILYGSDDNIWAAFGKSPNMSGEAGNLFDNGNGFPSIQSGSWSALMQSAVAETSGTDVGPQEEWSGSHFHNIDGSSANQRIPSALSSGSIPPTDDLNKLNVMGLKKHGGKFQNEPGQPVPTEMPRRFRPSLEEAKRSNHCPLQKTVAEDSQMYGNASQHSLYAERNAKTRSTTWGPGQSRTRQQSNGWHPLAVVSPGGDRASNVHETEELPQNSQNNQSKEMQEVLHGSSLWKSNSVPASAIEDPVKSTVGIMQANKRVLSLNDATASAANSCNMGVGDGASPFVQSNYLPNQWKNASRSAKQGVEGLGRMPDQVNEHNHGLRSLNSCDKDDVTRRNMENCAVRENSSDSHRSNISQDASGGFREGGLSSANDSTSLSQGKQKSTNLLARKVPVPPKFQYHPMGNLDEDVEPPHGQQPAHVQAISMQNTHFGQPKLFDQVSRNSTVTRKGELQIDNKVPDREPSCGSYPGYAPSISVPFSQTSDSCSPNNASSPGQNMLELLHKVDQSRDHGAVMHLSPSECNVSPQLPEAEKFGGAAGRLQRSQSSVSQGFGLQLGPPSQRLQLSDHSLSSPYKTRGNYHPEFSSGTPYGRSQLQANQITILSGKKDQHINSSFSGNASRPIQGGSAETVLPDASRGIQKDNLSACRSMAQQTSPYDAQDKGPAATVSTRDHMRGSQDFHVPGIARQGASGQVLHGMWTNVPASQHTLGAQYSKVPPHFSELAQPDTVEANSQGTLDGSKGGNLSSKFSGIHANSARAVEGEGHSLNESTAQLVSSENTDSAQKMEESLRKESSVKNQLDDSSANSASTQKDIEAFGRSLKPSNLSNERYALLNQMRALRNAEIDPSIRVSKRIKGPDNVLDVRQVNLMAQQQNEDNVRDSLGSSTGVPSEDSRMLSFPTSSDILQKNTSTNENVTSQDIVADGLRAFQRNPSTDCTASLRVDHGQVSPQMAPSWFNQYGSFKNGQLLPVHNAHKGTFLRPGEAPFTLGNCSSVSDAPNSEKCADAPVDACPVGITLQHSAPTSVANEHLSSPQSLLLNVTGWHQAILRPKKRKSATSELHPWHREISNGAQNISTLSVAETDWNRAANRLTEKVEEESELIEDGIPLLRSKRRLILTTQLMQQLYSPPPATVLSADASSAYESVTYAVSRVLLGDACRTVSHSSDLGLPSEGVNLHLIKGKFNGNSCFAKVTEELLERATKLENDFLRLDKSASILDLRVECQDLEKFSVINRFAKFHGRAQTDNADTASSDASASMLKPCAQRYVTAVQMPRSLPERVQCLSL